ARSERTFDRPCGELAFVREPTKDAVAGRGRCAVRRERNGGEPPRFQSPTAYGSVWRSQSVSLLGSSVPSREAARARHCCSTPGKLVGSLPGSMRQPKLRTLLDRRCIPSESPRTGTTSHAA